VGGQEVSRTTVVVVERVPNERERPGKPPCFGEASLTDGVEFSRSIDGALQTGESCLLGGRMGEGVRRRPGCEAVDEAIQWIGDVALAGSSNVAEGVRRKAVDGDVDTTGTNPIDGMDVDDARAHVCTAVGSAVAIVCAEGAALPVTG